MSSYIFVRSGSESSSNRPSITNGTWNISSGDALLLYNSPRSSLHIVWECKGGQRLVYCLYGRMAVADTPERKGEGASGTTVACPVIELRFPRLACAVTLRSRAMQGVDDAILRGILPILVAHSCRRLGRNEWRHFQRQHVRALIWTATCLTAHRARLADLHPRHAGRWLAPNIAKSCSASNRKDGTCHDAGRTTLFMTLPRTFVHTVAPAAADLRAPYCRARGAAAGGLPLAAALT